MKFCNTRTDIKRLVVCILLISVAVFLFFQRDEFLKPVYYDNQISEGNYEDILLINNDSYTYQYQTKDNKVDQILLKFENKNRFETEGFVKLAVLKGEVVVSTAEISAASLMDRENWAYFGLSEPLELNHKYTIIITAEDVKNAHGVYLVIDKDLQEAVTREVVLERDSTYNSAFLVLLGAFIFVCIPWKRVEKKLSEHVQREVNLNLIFSRCLLIITPALCFFIAESISGGLNTIIDMDNTKLLFILNIFLYTIITAIIYLFVNRAMVTTIIATLLTFLLGLLNYNLLSFKGTPLTASDVFGLKTGLNVIGNYTLVWNDKCILGFVIWVGILSIAITIGIRKGLILKKRVGLAAGVLLLVGGFYYIFIQADIPGKRGIEVNNFTISSMHVSTGTLLSFVITAIDLQVDVPKEYSAETVNKSLQGYESDDRTNNHLDKMPNVIVVMNESFADIHVNKPVGLNKDYMPFYRSLEENTIKGYTHVSVFGNRTANSEFEFLTGASMAFLPENSFPYQTYVLERTPSLTHTLKAQGYEGNIAFHPYIKNGWNRPKVYPLLGFQEYLAEDDVDDPKYVRSAISDESNYETVIREYENHRKRSEKPFYLFNVTMQNHGGYRDYQGVVSGSIEVVDEMFNDDTVRNYVNMMQKSDEALEDFINYFAMQNEDTIIVFFGDHQPRLDGVYTGATFGMNLDQISFESQATLHKTPYMIWANYDIPEGKMDISLNYLYPYLLSLIDANMTGYEKYLLDTYQNLPIISAIGYMGKDGIMRQHETPSEYLKDVEKYRMIQYNLLFDRKSWPEEKYFLRNK